MDGCAENLFYSAVNRASADAAHSLADAAKAKICNCLQGLFPEFLNFQLPLYLPRISIITGGNYPYEVYFDANDKVYGSGTFLFWYSTEISMNVKSSVVNISIG